MTGEVGQSRPAAVIRVFESVLFRTEMSSAAVRGVVVRIVVAQLMLEIERSLHQHRNQRTTVYPRFAVASKPGEVIW